MTPSKNSFSLQLAFFTSHPYPIHTSSSPRSALPSFTGSSSKEGPMVCGGGEAGSWPLSPRRSWRVLIFLTEGRHWSPDRPPLVSVSPQWPSPAATGLVSPEAREAQPVAPSPSSSCRAWSPGAPRGAQSRSPPQSHIGYLLRHPPAGTYQPGALDLARVDWATTCLVSEP
jgi:hypothetical protein